MVCMSLMTLNAMTDSVLLANYNQPCKLGQLRACFFSFAKKSLRIPCLLFWQWCSEPRSFYQGAISKPSCLFEGISSTWSFSMTAGKEP